VLGPWGSIKYHGQLDGQGVDYVVELGGGKLIWTLPNWRLTKLRVPMVTGFLRLASTDAPCIALGVLLHRYRGARGHHVPLPRSPDLVIVDSKVVAEAPVEFLVSGGGVTCCSCNRFQDDQQLSIMFRQLISLGFRSWLQDELMMPHIHAYIHGDTYVAPICGTYAQAPHWC